MEQLQEPRLHVNGYHLEKGLLFQFILSETLAASRQIHVIAHHNRYEHELIQAILELTGPLQEQMRLIAWTPNEGILTKLKGYCANLLHHVNPHDKVSLALSRLAGQSWLQCHNCLDAYNLWQEEPASRDLQDDLQKQLARLLQFHLRWTKLLAQKIKDFREDENVLFFLLRHHEDFDACFGEGFVRTLFLRLSPASQRKSLQAAEDFISQKYLKRGFESLLPIIKTKISELKCSAL